MIFAEVDEHKVVVLQLPQAAADILGRSKLAPVIASFPTFDVALGVPAGV